MFYQSPARLLALVPILSSFAAFTGAACSSSSDDAPLPGACSGACTDGGDATFGGDAADAADAMGCGSCVHATRLFGDGSGPRFDGCIYGAPIAFGEGAGRRILIGAGSGEIAAIVPGTGATDWQLTLPAPSGELPFVLATPVVVGRSLVVSYHTRRADGSTPDVSRDRVRNRVAVIDLDRHELDPAFPIVELAASMPGGGGTVSFEPGQAIGRGALVHGVPPGATLGRIYVTFGNVRDLQPWHGWLFEVDLDAWKAGGADKATKSVFLATPETDCGPRGSSGSRERKCGGGLWSPSGPLLYPEADGYALVVGPGNGQLDLARHDYANTLLRLRPGLAFEPGCDAAACAAFDPNAPSAACAESCRDLFIPRLAPGQSFVPESGACDGMSFFQCWQRLDYIGGSTPVRVRADRAGQRWAFAYPTKDGALYLVDGEKMGTMHDRAQLVSVCGTREDGCSMDWAGMIVTQPAVVPRGDEDVVIVPTFMPDGTHPAGVVALRVRVDGAAPKLERLWEFPRFDTPEARTMFRSHPSRLTAATLPGAREPYGFIVEAKAEGGRGRLYGLRLSDGALGVQASLATGGMRFSAPLVDDGVVYVSACESDHGRGSLEAFRVEVR